MSHKLQIRVYYEDTDLAGIVYYANYLKFIERARTEWVRGLGIDQSRLKSETGIVFAVRRIEADYLTPARFDELLEVETTPARIGGARIELEQRVLRGEDTCFAARVTLAALSASGAPARLPADLRERLASAGAGS
ncbi:MAG: tol-pal system-associated acyl-CoA thioesterase [Limimaricola soesokkakensis]|uniref:tol-pal system-associated acyl-CoA thioesterase n=1 Tax=Limimaricola soesokkakensis TaxID=1343159 RepID=UPI00405A3C66